MPQRARDDRQVASGSAKVARQHACKAGKDRLLAVFRGDRQQAHLHHFVVGRQVLVQVGNLLVE
ncbi:MAG: hypothetical protein V9G23_18350 [Giesbergeria sp.]